MRKLSIVLLLAIILGFATLPAQAQSNMRFQSVDVDLWPEYDQPQMLVIYRMQLDSSVSLPAEMVIRIPAATGGPHAVAAEQPDGLFTLPVEQSLEGEWLALRFTATLPVNVIEYYLPLTREGDQRSFAYRWPGDYAVDVLSLTVQQPIGSTNLVLSPSLTTTGTQNGLTIYNSNFGPLAAGQTFELSLRYDKPNDDLTIAQLGIEEVPISAEGDLNLDTLAIVVLAIAGISLIGGGVFWYWRSGQMATASESAPRRQRRSTAPRTQAPPPAGSSEVVYCHECGKRANPGDRFCR